MKLSSLSGDPPDVAGDLLAPLRPIAERVRPGAWLFRRRAEARAILPLIDAVVAAAPLRHMTTPGGHRMSVEMTNCGTVGWISDAHGYRYEAADPLTGRPWPAIPTRLLDLAGAAAAEAGFADFVPDACLVNRYERGTRLSAHQDGDERDFAQPIVSISLGLAATFFFQGETRGGTAQAVRLEDGDVLVFGGPARRLFHGVRPLAPGAFACRWNLTLRRAL